MINCSLDYKYYGIAQIRKKYPDEYNKIIEFNKNFENIHWGQMLYNYYNEISSYPECICGNRLNFIKFNRGYSRYCSNKCRYSDNELKQEIKEVFKLKYGVENPLQSEECQEKRKRNFLKKYGVEHQSQLSEVKEKKKQTCLDKYGVSTNLLHKDTKEKIKQTNLKKFGVEHNSQSEEIKEKKKQTNLKRYGVEYNFQSNEFKEKSEQTNLKKFGVTHTSLSSEIRKKQIVTKKKNRIDMICEILNIDISDILVNNEVFIIKNYCSKHKEFSISQNIFHQRWHKYNKRICTKCYPVQKQSSGSEVEIKKYIESLNINYIENDKKILGNRFEIDIYLPDYKLGIEFDGLYWHSDKFKDKNYHLNKTESCESQGIQLLHIFEDEWVHKKEIVKSIIKCKLNVFENIINNYEIREINNNDLIKEFLNNNHIQGYIESDIKIGLFNDNQLISLILFKKISENKYEILRFCDRLNTLVINSINNLLEYFINNFNPKSIITFLDRRYDNGNIYKQLGFNFDSNTEPIYHYFNRNDLIRYNSFEQIKENKNEKDMIFDCIYDCGNIKFQYNIY